MEQQGWGGGQAGPLPMPFHRMSQAASWYCHLCLCDSLYYKAVGRVEGNRSPCLPTYTSHPSPLTVMPGDFCVCLYTRRFFVDSRRRNIFPFLSLKKFLLNLFIFYLGIFSGPWEFLLRMNSGDSRKRVCSLKKLKVTAQGKRSKWVSSVSSSPLQKCATSQAKNESC